MKTGTSVALLLGTVTCALGQSCTQGTPTRTLNNILHRDFWQPNNQGLLPWMLNTPQALMCSYVDGGRRLEPVEQQEGESPRRLHDHLAHCPTFVSTTTINTTVTTLTTTNTTTTTTSTTTTATTTNSTVTTVITATTTNTSTTTTLSTTTASTTNTSTKTTTNTTVLPTSTTNSTTTITTSPATSTNTTLASSTSTNTTATTVTTATTTNTTTVTTTTSTTATSTNTTTSTTASTATTTSSSNTTTSVTTTNTSTTTTIECPLPGALAPSPGGTGTGTAPSPGGTGTGGTGTGTGTGTAPSPGGTGTGTGTGDAGCVTSEGVTSGCTSDCTTVGTDSKRTAIRAVADGGTCACSILDAGETQSCRIHSALESCMGTNGYATYECSAEGDAGRLPDFIGVSQASTDAMGMVKCRVCGISSSSTDLDTRPGFVQFFVQWGAIINNYGQYSVGNTDHEYQVWFIDSNGRMLGTEPAASVKAIPYLSVNKTCCDEDQYSATVAAAMPTGMASLMVVPAFKVHATCDCSCRSGHTSYYGNKFGGDVYCASGSETVNDQLCCEATPITRIYAPLPMGQTIAVTDVTTGSTKTVVTGTIGLEVAGDVDAFIEDPRNAEAIQKGLAQQANVEQQFVKVTLSKVLRRRRRLLEGRRLAANVNVAYEITVPEASTGGTGVTPPTATEIADSLSGNANLAALQTEIETQITDSGSTAALVPNSLTQVAAPVTETETTPAPVTPAPSPEAGTGGARRKSPVGMLAALIPVMSTLGLMGMLK